MNLALTRCGCIEFVPRYVCGLWVF